MSDRILTACFSATGVTLGVARTITARIGGDLFQILPAKPYTAANLNWNNSASRSSVEMKDPASRPGIADKVANMGEYSAVFLGFPIWWYDAPRIILTFLDSYDFADKIMFPFATSGSSGLGSIPQNLKKACPAADWRPGICFAGGPRREEAEAWVKTCLEK